MEEAAGRHLLLINIMYCSWGPPFQRALRAASAAVNGSTTFETAGEVIQKHSETGGGGSQFEAIVKFLHIQIILFAELDRRSIKGPPTSRSYKKEAVASVYGSLQEEKAALREEVTILRFSPESGFVREFTFLKVVHLMLGKMGQAEGKTRCQDVVSPDTGKQQWFDQSRRGGG